MWCWWLMTYESKGKPWCDWSDPDARSELVDGLVTDGLTLIEAVESVELNPEQADAVGLLGVVTGQDVEPDPDREGRWRIARCVAKDRTISTVDPQARHGHKTRTRKRDGYKAHIAAEPQTGLITAAVLTPANTPDAGIGTELVGEEPPGTHIIADSAYASGSALETFADNHHIAIVKPIVRKPRIKDGYHRDDFGIDTGARTVTCPARHTTRIRRSGSAPFSKWCNGCPLRTRCTTSARGRTITVDRYHDLRAANKTRCAKDETQNTYRTYRPPVERAIAWLTRHHPRRVPYRGLARNQQWLTTPTAAINPRTPHQPRTHPHHHRLGHQPRLEPQNPPAAPKEPRHRHQPTQNTHPTSPNRPHHTNTANSPNPIISRLLGDSFYPLMGNGGYDVIHYEIELDVNPSANTIDATTTLSAVATQDLSAFNLDLSGLDVEAVDVDGEPAAFSRDSTEMTVRPPVLIHEGEPFSVTVSYSGTPHPIDDPGVPFTTIGWN